MMVMLEGVVVVLSYKNDVCSVKKLERIFYDPCAVTLK